MSLCEYIMFAFQEKSYHWIEDWGLHMLGIAPDPGGYTSQRARIHDSKTGGGGQAGRCPQRRQEHHQVNHETSQVSLSKIFVCLKPLSASNQAGTLVGIASYSQQAWRTSSTQEQFMLASDMAPITIKRLVKWSSEQVFGIDGFNQAIKRAREYGDHRVIQSVTIQS